MFLLLLSIILSPTPALKPFVSIHISVSFWLLLLNLVVELEFCHQLSSACKSCWFIIIIHTNQRNKLHVFTHTNFVLLSAHIFLFCFCPWPYMLKRPSIWHHTANIFSIAVHLFRNLFSKICHLFEQILITCLKCFGVSFSPSSCSIKTRWDYGWIFSKSWKFTPSCSASVTDGP